MNKIPCPKAIFIEITNSCNFNCTFCPTHLMTRKKGFMDFELFKKIVIDAKIYGIERFNLWIMGEPFLHPQFFDFVKFTKENNIRLSLITNGSLFTESLVDKFFSLDLSKDDTLLVSCLASDTYAFTLRGTKAIGFDAYEKGIRDFIEEKIKRRTKVNVVLVYLVNIFEDIVPIPGLITDAESAMKTIATWQKFSEDIERKLNISFDYYLPTKSEIKRAIKKELGLTFEFLPGVFFNLKWLTNWGKVILPDGFKVTPSLYGYCAYPFETLGIFWNGDVTFCCDDYNGELVIGNIKEKSISAIYNGPEIKKIHSEMEKEILSRPRCQVCQGLVVDKQGKILRKYYKKYFLERIARHFKVHGLGKTTRKALGEIKAFFLKSKK